MNERHKISALMEELQLIKKCAVVGDPSRRQIEIKGELHQLWKNEELFWKQRSKVQWLKEGDANTRFFHLTTIQRRQRNRVLKIKNEFGDWLTREREVRDSFQSYSFNLFLSTGLSDFQEILEYVNPSVTEAMDLELTKPFTPDEIYLASHQLGSLKASGPDGFSRLFYHEYWNIVSLSAEAFHRGKTQMKILNKTSIALIPKVPASKTTTQFRPISLCNNSYKILSKILVNILKTFMPDFVSEHQNNFVANRHIQNNIIIAQEAFHYLKLKNAGKKFVAGLKIDMNKAYNRVYWNFLKAVMKKMSFSDTWVKLVMSCIITVSFSIVLNGKPGRFFKPSYGLKQGDPLSPTYF